MKHPSRPVDPRIARSVARWREEHQEEFWERAGKLYDSGERAGDADRRAYLEVAKRVRENGAIRGVA